MTTTLSKTKDNVINTPGGIIHVRPYRSSSNAQLKAVLSFTPRVSSLDRTNERSQTDEFRGFFVLFWIGLALLFLRTSMQSWEENRTPLSWTFGRLITGDALVLAISDILMVLTMFVCVPFVKGLQNRWYRYHWTGLILQHTFQTIYLGTAVWWGWHRQWYWVQSGFLVLQPLCNHTELTAIAQMHSYMSHNGMLATVYFQLQEEKRQLEEAIKHIPGGREQLLSEAADRKAHLEALEGPTPVGTPGPGTPALSSRSSFSAPIASNTTGYEDPSAALRRQVGGFTESSSAREDTPESGLAPSAEIRQRKSISKPKKKHQATDALPPPRPNLPLGTSLEPSHSTLPHEPSPPSPLAWSSNEQIALLARNIDAMQEELKSNGAKGLVWPQNVTYKHFLDFMFFPTLVYQLEYPRTKTMRPLVVVEKVVATLGTFSLIYTITEHYILPVIPKPGDPLLRSFINLALPMMVNYLFIIFECVCTGFAELSYFADREFYQDWWNSTSWDQFSRKWNKPVHTFLLRHVYASTMTGLQLSRTSAAFVTFLLSALCHELVMAVVTKKIRPYLFLMQMAQLPMIALGKLPIVKRNKTVGNIVFWAGLMSGFPLL
uniref:O-acyltransferase n=1 Tax=Kwoniella bestiolae CBS 10118 TaxID=1296100 RepID=A0A1B9GCG9_9TREE|nr:sterol O-acyltransferase [Kwoniella bestiolae CBS 10118]OCF28715.1 sterol O-acyltransferase [Kwoniella bestiolae CBS 10118]